MASTWRLTAPTLWLPLQNNEILYIFVLHNNNFEQEINSQISITSRHTSKISRIRLWGVEIQTLIERHPGGSGGEHGNEAEDLDVAVTEDDEVGDGDEERGDAETQFATDGVDEDDGHDQARELGQAVEQHVFVVLVGEATVEGASGVRVAGVLQ